MGKKHNPRRGSMAYTPKVRAKRIYPRVHAVVKINEVKPLEFAGYKVGMARISMIDDKKNSATGNQEIVVPVTVLETPMLKVAAVRAYKKTPYGSEAVTDIWTSRTDELLALKANVPEKPKRSKILA